MNKLIELWEDLNVTISADPKTGSILPSVAVILVAFVLEISFVIFMIGSFYEWWTL